VNLQRKTQLQLKQPLSNRDIDDNDNIVVDDEVTFGRNKKVDQFGKLIHEDVELSDYVKFRLWLARQLALKKFNETRA
jgi:hypothetical protein